MESVERYLERALIFFRGFGMWWGREERRNSRKTFGWGKDCFSGYSLVCITCLLWKIILWLTFWYGMGTLVLSPLGFVMPFLIGNQQTWQFSFPFLRAILSVSRGEMWGFGVLFWRDSCVRLSLSVLLTLPLTEGP